jgi:hypothetical protein
MLSPRSSSPQDTLQIISGSDYLRRQEETKHRWAGCLVIPTLILWSTSLILSLGIVALAIPRLAHIAGLNLPSWASGVAFGMLLLALALLPLVERLVQERDRYDQGRRGEDATAQALQQHLDGRWTLFRNVLLPGHQADIDAVLVGPPGVYALEIKSFRGRYRNRGDQWWRRGYQPGWRRLAKSPSRRVKASAASLSEYLHRKTGDKVWVEPRVVWVGPGKLDIQGKPAVYVWFLDNLATYVADLVKAPAKPKDVMGQIWKALMEAAHTVGKGRDD